MLAIRSKTFALPRLAIISGLVYFLVAILFIPRYLHWDGNLFTALALAIFICVADSSRRSSRFLLPALLMMALAIFIPVNTMLFLALVLATLLWAENIIGKLNDSFMFLLFVVSPVFKYLTGMFDFPVRLGLTGQTAALLTFTGVKATAIGNHVRLANQDFSVDPACAGLNMLIISAVAIFIYFDPLSTPTGQIPEVCLPGRLFHSRYRLKCSLQLFPHLFAGKLQNYARHVFS